MGGGAERVQQEDHSVRILQGLRKKKERDERAAGALLRGPHLPSYEDAVFHRETAYGGEDDTGVSSEVRNRRGNCDCHRGLGAEAAP